MSSHHIVPHVGPTGDSGNLPPPKPWRLLNQASEIQAAVDEEREGCAGEVEREIEGLAGVARWSSEEREAACDALTNALTRIRERTRREK